MTSSHIFLSYSRQDTPIMQQISDYLVAEGFAVWTDVNLVPGTRGWKMGIEKAIESASAVVAILTPDAKSSEWVDRELEYARIHGLRIFPVLAAGDAVSSVPFELVNAQWIDIVQADQFGPGLEKLVLALDHHLGIRRKSRAELLHEELARLAARLPGTYWIGIFSVDGLTLAFHSPSDDFAPDADRAAAMSSASLMLGERINTELESGEMRYVIIGGSTGYQFQIAFKRYVLCFGLRQVGSLDAIFIVLRQFWQPVLDLLDIEAPE